MSHKVTEAELLGYVEQKRQEWVRFACSSSGDARAFKKLEFCIRHVAPTYRVTCGGEVVYDGPMNDEAVREYNRC